MKPRILFSLVGGLILAVLLLAGLAQTGTQAGSAWYVSPLGDDSQDCTTPLTPCKTINHALSLAAPDSTIYAASGVYTDTGSAVIGLDKDIVLSGGWEAAFNAQTGASIIDGELERRGVEIAQGVVAAMDHIEVRNGATFQIQADANGAGIYNHGELTLAQASIHHNQAWMNGGGIANSGVLTLTQSSVWENSGNAAGIVNFLRMKIDHAEIYNNHTTSSNGGIISNGPMQITNSSIHHNTASTGPGGISVYNSVMVIVNSTISHNSAGSYSGGLLNEGGTVDLYNTTVSANTASGQGGGIYIVSGSVTLHNSLVANNLQSGVVQDCYGMLVSAGYSLVSSLAGCTYSPGIGDVSGGNPGLGAFEGSPGYQTLLPTSPAVNSGDPDGCKDSQGNPNPTDQRGYPRLGRCEMGAYELQALGFSDKTSKQTAYVGQFVDYTISLKNPGATLLNGVQVTDTLPISLSYASGSLQASAGSYGYAGGVITWTGSLQPGDLVTVTFSGKVGKTGAVTNTALIRGGGELFSRSARVEAEPVRVFLPCLIRDCPLLYFDGFGDPASGWPIQDSGDAAFDYLSGEYRILVRSAQSGAVARPGFQAEEYVLSVDVRNQTAEIGSYGLAFGVSAVWDTFYTLEIFPNGNWGLYRNDPGGVTPVQEGFSPAIHQGTASNHLQVMRTGSVMMEPRIKAYANGQLLIDVVDYSYLGVRYVGLAVFSYSQPNVDIRFDNFSVRPLSCGLAETTTRQPALAAPGWKEYQRTPKD
jgi:uncharacterized repeat protein (TIGR01451 family)